MPRPGGSPERSDESVAERSKVPEETSAHSPGGAADARTSAPFPDPQDHPRAIAGELAALADALLEQAGALRRHYEELLELLDQGRDPPAGEAQVAGRPVARMPSGAPPTAGRPPARSTAPRRSGPGEGASGLAASGTAGEARGDEGAMLVALQMALNGTPREEAAAYLRETFGIEGDDILEEAYGRTRTAPAAPTQG